MDPPTLAPVRDIRPSGIPDSLAGTHAVERACLELESCGPGTALPLVGRGRDRLMRFVRSTAVTRLSEAGERRLDAEWSAASRKRECPSLLAVRRVLRRIQGVSGALNRDGVDPKGTP